MTTLDDPILYRIIDFFELVASANTGTLRVSCATRFSDCSELVGVFLSILDDPSCHPYTERAMAEAISRHQLSKQHYFISSWTMSRDSIAMWELYSRDAGGIQIGVRKSVLEAMFDAYWKEHSFALGHNAPPDDGRVLFYPVESRSCEYVEFDEILDHLKSRYKTSYRELDAEVGNPAAFKEAFTEFAKNRVFDFQKALFLKDRAYSYESEYRFVLKGITRNNRPYEECQKDQFFVLFDTHMRPVTQSDAGENISIPFDTLSIEEIWIDGRTPPWKQEVLRALLRKYGWEAKLSAVYGSFFDRHQIKPII